MKPEYNSEGGGEYRIPYYGLSKDELGEDAQANPEFRAPLQDADYVNNPALAAAYIEVQREATIEKAKEGDLYAEFYAESQQIHTDFESWRADRLDYEKANRPGVDEVVTGLLDVLLGKKDKIKLTRLKLRDLVNLESQYVVEEVFEPAPVGHRREFSYIGLSANRKVPTWLFYHNDGEKEVRRRFLVEQTGVHVVEDEQPLQSKDRDVKAPIRHYRLEGGDLDAFRQAMKAAHRVAGERVYDRLKKAA